MSLINRFMRQYLLSHHKRILQFKRQPLAVQEKLRTQLIHQAIQTQFGQEHDFQNIGSEADFKQAIPLRTYEDFRPYIKQMMEGEPKILWPDPITWFVRSAGTTSGQNKFIPVSRKNMVGCHNQGTKDALCLWYHRHPQAHIFSRTGKGLIMGGRYYAHPNPNIKVADVSAMLIDKMASIGWYFLTPDFKTCLLPDWEEKLHRIAEMSSTQNVTNLSGMPTWSLKLFQRVLDITKKDNLLEVWPNFQLFAHGGVDFRHYKKHFQDLLPGDQVHYINIYNASEGFFAIQDQSHSDDMLLLLNNGVYFEFLPLGQNDKTLNLEEVETGVPYEIIITTNAGLWRYRIGDLIEFTSLKPHRIRIVGRTTEYLNAFGEMIQVGHTDEAINQACKSYHAKLNDYTVAPSLEKNQTLGTYHFLLDFEKPPKDISAFSKAIDLNLQALNSNYKKRRKNDFIIGKPKIEILPPHTFFNYFKANEKLGGQYKVPRLRNDSMFIDQISQFIKS